MTAIDLAPRMAAKREQEQKRIDDELFQLARLVPQEVLKPLLKAIVDKSPAPLFKLPAQWRKKALGAWRACMTGKVKGGPWAAGFLMKRRDEPPPSAKVLQFPVGATRA